MFRLCCLSLSLTALLATPAVSQNVDLPNRADRAQVRAANAIAGLRKSLKDARRLLTDIDDQQLRERLELLLARAALQADDLEELLGSRPRQRKPISAADFAKLLRGIKEQAFDEDKVEFIETFVKDRPISCEQTTQVLKLLAFDDGRVKAAVVMYPSIVDSENFFEVLKIFPFDSNRKAVMEAVRKKKKQD